LKAESVCVHQVETGYSCECSQERIATGHTTWHWKGTRKLTSISTGLYFLEQEGWEREEMEEQREKNCTWNWKRMQEQIH